MRNKTVHSFYRTYFYYDLGKAQVSKFTNPLNEWSAIVVILTFVFGFNLTQHKSLLGIMVIIFLISITLFGLFYKKSGLYDREMIVNANRNIVSNEMYRAAKKINEEK